MRLIIVALILLASPISASQDDFDCDDLVSCEAELVSLGIEHDSKYNSISRKQQDFSRHILGRSFDPVSMLIRLIEHEDRGVRNLAAYTLSEMESISPEYLSVIERSIGKISWLANSLVAVGTEEAARVAVGIFLKSVAEQKEYGIRLAKNFGDLSLPYLLEYLKCEDACPEGYTFKLAEAIAESKAEISSIVSGLKGLLSDKSLSDEAIVGVLHVVGELEGRALSLEDNLLALLVRKPNLEPQVNNTFRRIGTKQGIQWFINKLSQVSSPDPYYLIELAKYGQRAHAASDYLVSLISHEDKDIRYAAIRTLGFVQNVETIPVLIDSAKASFDVHQNIMAIKSLSQMKSKIALPALEGLSSSHWYPSVRDAASNAIKQIESDASVNQEHDSFRSLFGYLDSGLELPRRCEKVVHKSVAESSKSKLYMNFHKEELEKLSFNANILSYGAAYEEEQKMEGKEIVEVHPGNIVEHREDVVQVPHLALRIEDGWFAGSDRGEWGGELVYLPDDGEPQVILWENIEDIYRLGDSIIVTSGLAHLGMSNGVIYRLNKNAENEWGADVWIQLPGAPATSWFVDTGELLINMYPGGSILLSKDGTMRMATCT